MDPRALRNCKSRTEVSSCRSVLDIQTGGADPAPPFFKEFPMPFRKLILANIEEIISGTALTITISIVAINVIFRYFFSMSFNWAEEIATIAFAWVVFVGAAACYKRKMHIGIDVLMNVMPSAVRKTLETGIGLFLLALNCYLFYLSVVFAASAWDKPTAVLLLPYTFVDGSACVGFAFMIYHAAKQIAETVKSQRRA